MTGWPLYWENTFLTFALPFSDLDESPESHNEVRAGPLLFLRLFTKNMLKNSTGS